MTAADKPLTIAHVTHEAVEHFGGIGTVLQGMVTSPVYAKAVRRSIFIGPTWDYGPRANPVGRLGPEGVRVLYSGLDGHDPEGLGAKLKPIEWAFHTRIVYGVRRVEMHNGSDRAAEVELLLFDLRQAATARIEGFKQLLRDRFGVDASRYEHDGDFVQWLRLGPPAIAALHAVVNDEELPAIVISHEYMGMPTALLASLDAKRRFRTVFHAHECATARRIVEGHSGHDCAFYPAMRRAMAQGRRVEQVFGDQSDFARHALVSRAHRLDVSLAVGDETAEELRFLSDEMARSRIELCYNGVPAEKLTNERRATSRALVNRWLRNVLGFTPDFLFTHVTRPVISKGLWRDLKLAAHLERELKQRGKTAVYLLLTCGAPIRTREQCDDMARRYGWPRDHHEGHPDLQGPEVGLWHMMRLFNNPARPGAGAVTALLVNQFGFSQDRLGSAAPAEITISDLRRAADVELGLSTYEPFGIAPLEPLHAGAVCVASSVSGCCGFARRALGELGWDEAKARNLLVVDFTDHDARDSLHLSQAQRDAIEERAVDAAVPGLLERLPWTENDRLRLLEHGQALALRMGWDRVCEKELLPVLRSIL